MESKTFGARLKAVRLSKDMSQEQLADKLGTSKQVISRYENNLRTPKISVLADYAEKLDVDLHYLLGEPGGIPPCDNIIPMPKMRQIPLVGDIACGTPVLAQENIEGYIDIPDHVHADFALRCKGDSMKNARILDGDIVYIRKQPEVENGEIAAVLIGEEATLKRVYISAEAIVLQPENPEYPPLTYIGEKMADVAIIGKAVAFTSPVK